MYRRLRKTSVCFWVLILIMGGISWLATQPVAATDGNNSTARLASHHSVLAQASTGHEAACWSLDVVLLIDQSWSMHSPHPLDRPADERAPASDPKGFRFDAAKDIIDRLLFNRRDQCSEAIHRVGVIMFGHRTDDVLTLVQLDPDPALDVDATIQWAQGYKEDIDEAGTDRTQQGTDIRIAFEAAEDMLSNAPPIDDPPHYDPRRQVVLLLTDGNPAGVGDVESYMCELMEYLDASDWDEHYIWVVALNSGMPYLDNRGCDGPIRRNWQYIAEQHGGRLADLPYNLQLVPSVVREITTEMLGRSGIELACGVPFFVEPYVELGTFTFFRDDPELAVTLSKSDDIDQTDIVYELRHGQVQKDMTSDQSHGMELESYTPEAYKEVYRIRRPRPGRWQFDVAGLSENECRRRISAYYEPVGAEVVLVSPRTLLPQVLEDPYYDPEASASFEVSVEGPAGRLLPQEELYPLDVRVIWALPSGNTALPNGEPVQPFELHLDEQGHWVSESPVLAPEEGQYPISIVATSRHADPEEDPPDFDVARQSAHYEVRHLERFGFTIEEPVAHSVLPCNAIRDHWAIGQPIDIAVRLRDSEQRPAGSSTYRIAAPDEAFTAVLLDSDGGVLDTITLKSSSAESGVFRGRLLEEEVVRGCGEVKVVVTFDGLYDVANFILPVTTIEAPLTRVRSEGVETRIISPQDSSRLPLHGSFTDAVLDAVALVPVEIELYALDGSPLNPTVVAAGAVAELYTAKMIGSDPSRWESLVLTVTERVDHHILVATGGSTLADEGTYQLVLIPQQAAFSEGYIPVQTDPYVVTFERRDHLWTRPGTTRSAIGVASVLLLAIVGVFVGNILTRPKGIITFKHRKTGLVMHEESMGHPWRGLWHKYKSKDPALKDLGLSKIEATRARAPEGDSRAVNLVFYDENGDPFIQEEVVSSGEEFDLDVEIVVRYD